MEIEKRISERIRYVRGKLSQAEFAKKLRVSKSSVGNYETEKQVPGARFLWLVCEYFNVEPRWLLKGEGPVYENDEIINNRLDHGRHNLFMVENDTFLADLEEEITIVKERLEHAHRMKDEYKKRVDELKEELKIAKMERELAEVKFHEEIFKSLQNMTQKEKEVLLKVAEEISKKIEKERAEIFPLSTSLSPTNIAVPKSAPSVPSIDQTSE